MSRSLASVIIAGALVLTACGGSSNGDATSSPAPAGEAAPASEGTAGPATGIPAIEVIDVGTGDTIDLRSFAPNDTPLLFWFWAPH